jgi:hypothetical protein
MEDRIPSELRAAEQEVDEHYAENPLMKEPFSRAAWHFLAICEEHSMRHIIHEASNDGEYAAVADNLINHARWPLRWLISKCSSGGKVPSRCDENLYSAALQLSDLALSYGSFAAAFSYATWGLVTLDLVGSRIKSSGPMIGDVRFEAYDRLLRNKTAPSAVELVDVSFAQQVTTSVRVRGDSFDYPLTPKIVQSGIDALTPAIDCRFALPVEWRFPRFTLEEFRRIARVLWVLAFIHFQARVAAADLGCEGLGVSRALLLMEHGEFLRRVRRYSGLPQVTTSAILEILTYGAAGQSNPDPALQPLIPLSSSVIAISPTLLLNSSMERNLSVLLNRLPDEKAAYSALSQTKETALRQRLIQELSCFGFRFWHGQINEWGVASEIDLAVISDDERRCLVLELKAFIGPAEPRELCERSEEIQRGINQIRDRMRMAITVPAPLRARLDVNETYRFSWAVASETSIGAPYVQSPEVPVINTRHLVSRFRRDPMLAACCLWLETRAYLPIEGVHYQTVPMERSVGNWTLEWYGIRPLTDEYILL